jgi:hypothetical protein
MSAAARSAGACLENENSTADPAPVAGECELLHSICCHVDKGSIIVDFSLFFQCSCARSERHLPYLKFQTNEAESPNLPDDAFKFENRTEF